MTTWESVSRGHIFEILKDYEYTNKWLDIGSGKGNQTYSTLDKNKGVQATYTGDIRTLFAPVYNKKVDRKSVV